MYNVADMCITIKGIVNLGLDSITRATSPCCAYACEKIQPCYDYLFYLHKQHHTCCKGNPMSGMWPMNMAWLDQNRQWLF